MKTIIILYTFLSVFLTAQPAEEKTELADWKFLAFQGAEKVYYLPTSLRSVGDIFRVKLLWTSERPTDIQYTVFVEDYNRADFTNRVVQVNTYDKFWQPIDQINIEKCTEHEQWVHIKKGSESYKIFERLIAGVKKGFSD